MRRCPLAAVAVIGETRARVDPSDDNTAVARGSLRTDDGATPLYPDGFAARAQIGNYVVETLLSRGGCAECIERTTSSSAAVALKVRTDRSPSRRACCRFEQEPQAVDVIRHPNIVDVIEFGELDDRRPYMVMELLSGHGSALRSNDSSSRKRARVGE